MYFSVCMLCLCLSIGGADIGGARRGVGSPGTEVSDGVRYNMGFGK